MGLIPRLAVPSRDRDVPRGVAAHHRRALLAGIITVVAAFAARAQDIPVRPEKEPYEPLKQVLPTDEAIRFYQELVRREPRNSLAFTYLAQMYVRRARERGTHAGYDRAEAALRRALELDPQEVSARALQAAVWCAQHKFAQGIERAREVYAKNPDHASLLLVMGDAQLETGAYEEARQTYREFERLSGSKESPEILARQARLEELYGRPAAAERLLLRAGEALSSVPHFPADQAWYATRLGEIDFARGKLGEAAKHYEKALAAASDYEPALAGLGQVRAAQSRYDDAVRLYRRALSSGPRVPLLAALGRIHAAMGNDSQAQVQYRLLDLIARQGGQERDLALYLSDHDRDLPKALELARAELSVRKDIYTHDALAWALYKNKRHDEASAAIKEAMKLGTQDASLFYHAGMIALAQGDKETARGHLEKAMSINSHFSLSQAPLAAKALAELKREPSSLQPPR